MSTLSPIYSRCATQGNSCPISTISEAIAYADPNGTGNIYYRNSEANKAFTCNNASFGNQTNSTAYQCYNGNLPTDFRTAGSSFYENGIPKGWTKCSDENETCDPKVNSDVDILFGADGSYVYSSAKSVPCNINIFGDPKQGVKKACYWRSPLIPINHTPSTPITPTTPSGTQTTGHKWWVYLLLFGIPLLILIFLIIFFIAKK
ncbi:hypothetical protein [Acanthamoeba polyphaga mimivirus]|nr:hypothetical protein [Acanthamoeba castellanii mamavirus]EJN41111.1 hypothetical protein lvs_L608 [Acanthamoeba polyphaga lentillevirus]UMZ07749.1 hypothetical protein [Acanthamoeba polyphaga mimivirus]